MEIKPKQPTVKGPAEWFTGDVWLDSVVQAQERSTLNVAAVHFTPGARTAWHTHDGGQTLYVTEGAGRSSPAASPSLPSVPVTSFTRPRASGTGTAPRPNTS